MKLKTIRGIIRYKGKLIEEISIIEKGNKESNDSIVERWTYSGELRLEGVANTDYMMDISVEAIAIDGLGKEYTHKFQE